MRIMTILELWIEIFDEKYGARAPERLAIRWLDVKNVEDDRPAHHA